MEDDYDTPRDYREKPKRGKQCIYATWAVIYGILGFFLVLPALAAVVFGHMALARIERSEGRLRGVRLAVAALAMGYTVLLIVSAVLVIFVVDRIAPSEHPSETRPATAVASGKTTPAENRTTETNAAPITSMPVTPTTDTSDTLELKLPTTGPAVVPAPQWNQPNLVVCVRELEAFDPRDPKKSIGRFGVNTPLIIGDKDEASGKYRVTFKPSKGPEIHGLCNAADLGR